MKRMGPPLGALAWALIAAPGLAAQTASPTAPPVRTSSAVSFQIEAQPVISALKEFATQAGVQMIYRTSDISSSEQTTGLSGNFTPDAALSRLLAHTNLAYNFLDGRTVSISLAAAAPQQKLRTAAVSDQGPRAAVSATAAPPREADLQEVVVSAQKRDERVGNVPISISVLGGNELDRSTAAGLSEVLNTVSGVSTQSNYLGGGTVVVIRGVAPSFPAANGASPVAYYLDSVPFGLVRSAIGPDQDPFDLSRLEVLRGPQGTLYGASALNGVVRVLTHDADLDAFDLKLSAADSYTQYGSNNYRGDLAVNVPLIQDKLAVRAVLGYSSDSGWIDQPNKNNVNDSERKNYRIKLNAQPTEELSLGLSAWSSRSSADAPSIGYAFNENEAVLDQPLFTDFDAYSAKVGYELPFVSISSATSYLDYSNAGNLDLISFGLPGSIFFSGITSNVFSEELNLSSRGLDDWRWTAGAIYRRATEKNVQTFSNTDIPPELVKLTSKSYAVFGELTRLLLDGRLELTAGLRHFHDDLTQIGQFGEGTPIIPGSSTAEANTPRAIVTWHQTQYLMGYASYSQGFRSGFPQDPTVPEGFPGVRPDRLRNYELGSKGTFLNGLLSYDASVYYMKWQGIQQSLTVPYADVTTQAIVNGEGASGVGTDISFTLKPLDRLSISLTGSWNSLEFDSDVVSGGLVLFRKGDRPTSSPEVTAGLSAQYSFPLCNSGYQGSLSASGNYISPQSYRGFVGDTLTDLEVDSGDPMVLASVRFAVDLPEHWRATLFADNVTNERGAPVRAFVGVRDWDARVRPRTIGLQLDYHLH